MWTGPYFVNGTFLFQGQNLDVFETSQTSRVAKRTFFSFLLRPELAFRDLDRAVGN